MTDDTRRQASDGSDPEVPEPEDADVSGAEANGQPAEPARQPEEPTGQRVDPADDPEIDRAVGAIADRDPAAVETDTLESIAPGRSERAAGRGTGGRRLRPGSSGTTDQVVSAPTAASTSQLPYIDDLRSRGWVVVVALIFGGIFLSAMLFGAGGPLAQPRVRPSIEPFPSEDLLSPGASVEASGSPEATGSGEPPASAEPTESVDPSPSAEPSEPTESVAPSAGESAEPSGTAPESPSLSASPGSS